ncbi:MAG TPA: hypothetical protein VL856_16760 [Acidimicrobiia bacterium]|nr:hypothetical protein [Acidimicrobiia bacterium]
MTGVQAVGAKGLHSVQVAAVDTKEAARVTSGLNDDDHDKGDRVKAGEPQPVVFPRDGLPLDQRPVELRHQIAALHYRRDGGEDDQQQQQQPRQQQRQQHRDEPAIARRGDVSR